jgi:syntaxin 5
MSEDRTNEFLSIARSLPPTAGANGSSRPAQRPTQPPPPAAQSSAFSELRGFHQEAAGISRDIASTSALLTELTNLVRHRSLFQDDAAAVNQLVVRIKTAIEHLNSRLDSADSVIKRHKRQLNSQAGQEAANLVSGLQTEFAEAAADFKKVLQQRTENMRETDQMQKQVYGGGADDIDDIPDMSSHLSAPPPVYGGPSYSANAFPTLDLTSSLQTAGQPTASSSSALPRPHGIVDGGGGSMAAPHHLSGRAVYSGQYSNVSSGNAPPPLTPLDIARAEEESQLRTQLIPDQSYLQQRADAMAQVESNIVELGTIFNKLAGLVHEHQEMVQRVDDNVQDSHENVTLSMAALTDTLENLRSNRALALRVGSILVAFIIFFIIFFA